MKIHKYNEMMKWLTRPKAKPMPITKYIDTMNRLYGTDEYGNKETATTRIQELDKKPKKKVIKKTLIVEKPKPVKPPIIDYLELQDWLNEVDPNWFDEKPKDEVLLKVPKSKLSGLASILKRG